MPKLKKGASAKKKATDKRKKKNRLFDSLRRFKKANQTKNRIA